MYWTGTSLIVCWEPGVNEKASNRCQVIHLKRESNKYTGSKRERRTSNMFDRSALRSQPASIKALNLKADDSIRPAIVKHYEMEKFLKETLIWGTSMRTSGSLLWFPRKEDSVLAKKKRFWERRNIKIEGFSKFTYQAKCKSSCHVFSLALPSPSPPTINLPASKRKAVQTENPLTAHRNLLT